jgi:peptidoglycan/LPS O-acetylase OafA/YrhL
MRSLRIGEGPMDAKQRLPSLDGLRAIAATMVVLGHSEKLLKVGRRMPFGSGVVDAWGPAGVTAFFAISGFLITTLLLGEKREAGSIDLRSFYLRRTFRILPAYWVYLGAIALLAAAGVVMASPRGFAHAVSFTTDYVNPDSWVLNHSWSLSVEEQFYLLWPAAVVALGAVSARRMALCLILAAPVLRVVSYFVSPHLRPSMTAMLHFRMDALMVGCWAALERAERPASRLLEWLARPATALVGAIYCVLLAGIARWVGGGLVTVGICHSLEALGACAVLLWAIRSPESTAGRFLNWGPVAHLGAISYSLYLWQQLWLSHERPTPLWQAPLLIAGAVLCAEASYRFVEQPMLRLRARFIAGGQAARSSSPARPAP